jgi:hypothetical protein
VRERDAEEDDVGPFHGGRVEHAAHLGFGEHLDQLVDRFLRGPFGSRADDERHTGSGEADGQALP